MKHFHGLSQTHPLYTSWMNMRNRCSNPNNPAYERYGGRGIAVCERWDDFALFVADVGSRPAGMSIDRIDNNRGYEPGNVRWATPLRQAGNRRRMTRGKAAWTHCARGHEFTPSNTIIVKSGHRRCRQCGRDAQRSSYHQRKAAK